jgi:hypothetical protein
MRRWSGRNIDETVISFHDYEQARVLPSIEPMPDMVGVCFSPKRTLRSWKSVKIEWLLSAEAASKEAPMAGLLGQQKSVVVFDLTD